MGTDSGASGFDKGIWISLQDSLTWIEVAVDTQFTRRAVNSIAVGKDQSLWFGLAGGGLKRWRKFAPSLTWQTFIAPDIAFNVVTSVAVDKLLTGDVWVGTPFGLSRFIQSQTDPTQGRWEQYDARQLPSVQILSIAVDFFNGCTYFGTAGGLGFLDANSNWKQIQFPPNYQFPIAAIAFDMVGYVWLGKWQGMTRIQNNFLITEFTSQNTGGSLPHGAINAAVTDFSSNRWFGSNYGLVELKDTTWSRFDMKSSPLPSSVVTSLIYDKGGNLWIGTAAGVAVYNPQGIKF